MEIVEEGSLPFQRFDFAGELNLIPPEGLFEGLEKQTAEQTRQDTHRQEEPGAAMDPLAIGADPAAGNDEVDRGMMEQILSPRVEDAEEADLGAEMLGIAREGEQSFGGGAEEDAVNHFLVVKGDAGDLPGDGKDDVEDKTREFQQISGAEPSLTGCQSGDSVFRCEVSPVQWSLALATLFVDETYSLFAAVLFAGERFKLTAGERVKGMGDPKLSWVYSTNACSATPLP